jgi:hypothetical protein
MLILVVIPRFALSVVIEVEFTGNKHLLGGRVFDNFSKVYTRILSLFAIYHKNWILWLLLAACAVILSKQEELTKVNSSCLFNCSKKEITISQELRGGF